MVLFNGGKVKKLIQNVKMSEHPGLEFAPSQTPRSPILPSSVICTPYDLNGQALSWTQSCVERPKRQKSEIIPVNRTIWCPSKIKIASQIITGDKFAKII